MTRALPQLARSADTVKSATWGEIGNYWVCPGAVVSANASYRVLV
jgi:hypothetical protein